MSENISDITIEELLEEEMAMPELSHKEKYEKVLRYLVKEQEDCKDEYRELVKKINYLENKISEIYKVISLSEKDMDPNFSLFSPVVTNSGKLNNNLYEEVHQMENELQQDKFTLKKLDSKLSVITENIQCIKYSIDNLAEDEINKSEIIASTDGTTISEEGKELELSINNVNNNIDTNIYCNNSKLAILESQEQERSRIAMELHDSVVQNLTSLIHKTELCTKLVDKDTIRTKLELQTMIGTLKNSINEIRTIIYNLKPMALDDLGLRVTLERYIKQLELYSGFSVNLELPEEDFDSKLSDVSAVSILKIVQECCNNAIKHSGGNRININISIDKNLEVQISDNGEGFELDDNNNVIVEKDSFGMSIMQERAHILSGNVKFSNSETGSAVIIVSIPLDK